MTTLNRPLIEAIISQLTEHPETHNQTDFGTKTKCGTSHCVAGWAVELDPRYTIEWVDGLNYIAGVTDASGNSIDVTDAAKAAMGIGHWLGSSLFYDFGDTHHMIERLQGLLEEDSSEHSSL